MLIQKSQHAIILMRNNIRNFIKKFFPLFKSKTVIIIASLLIIVITLDLIFPLPKLKPYSKVIYAKDGSLLTAYLSLDDKWRMKTRLDEVSPDLIKAILAKEDNWFYWHPGVNPIAVVRAFFQNILSGKRVSGASTITMQLARIMVPAKRTYLNKFVEMLRAFQIELHFSKKEILEMYLSYLPYGGNIEGVKSAAYIYFNRPPDKLSLSQAIALTVIPNDPNNLRLDKNPFQVMKERNQWIKTFTDANLFSQENLQDAIDEPVLSSRYAVNNEAPHFCRFVSENYPGDEIYTSLVQPVQKTAEKILLSYVNRVKAKMVSNGSVLIIDNKTNSVAAYCGSADFFDNSTSGQVNGITAIRSPGSTLKPFLYTLAFDTGELTPDMRLLDVPTDFGGYEPENYDLKYNGPVTAKFALVNSLNVPAVSLLRQIGLEKFLSFLQKNGFSDIAQNKNSLGLSLILGGCGTRLEQLTKAYTVFSHGGKLYPLTYLKPVLLKDSNAVKIFSAQAAYLTGSLLTTNERPDYPADFLSATDHPLIAWKTGTSYGKRDAWAIGFNPDYTIGVWMGNFDGKGSPELSGAETAVPLLFELFDAVDPKPKKLWFDRPAGLYLREVCSETGLLPTENCTHTEFDYYIENVSPNKKCDLYKTVYVNKDETIQYCPECLPKDGYKKVKYPFYDSELMLWMMKNKIAFKRLPPHNPLCQTRLTGEGPKIVSPSPDYEYYVENNSKQQILLQAAPDPSVKTYYWYINNVFYKKSRPGEKLFFRPDQGELPIICLDDRGRKSTISIKVIYY